MSRMIEDKMCRYKCYLDKDEVISIKAEFLNEEVFRETNIRTAEDRAYAKEWNACNNH